MMSRKPPYWPYQQNIRMDLGKVIYWLESRLRSCDLIECVAICEAISIVQDRIGWIDMESRQREAIYRAQWKRDREEKKRNEEGRTEENNPGDHDGPEKDSLG